MKKQIRSLFLLGMLVSFSATYAEENKPAETPLPPTLSFYQQPDEKSAVVGAIKPGGSIIPIFTQGEWLKIADPSNGNVGWVKDDALKKRGIPAIKTVVQYPASDKERAEFMQQWQAQRQEMQKMFMQALEQNKKAMDAMAKEFQDMTYPFPIPADVQGLAKVKQSEQQPTAADKK